jgi:hypothetical protein
MVRFAGVLGGVCVAVLVCASSALAGFGLSGFEESALNRDGSVDMQAGSHPHKLVTSFELNGSEEYGSESFRPFGGGPKDAEVVLPGGLMGNPNATPRCAYESFIKHSCPNDTAIGVATSKIASPNGFELEEPPSRAGEIVDPLYEISNPVYNVEPPTGVVAEFGFFAKTISPVLIQASLRTGGDYGITVHVHNIPQAVVVQDEKVVIWGVPGEASHDPVRGSCLAEGEDSSVNVLVGVEPPHNEEGSQCTSPGSLPVRPLLTLPSACGGPLSATGSMDDWEEPGVFYTLASGLPPVTGCEKLSFDPSLSIAPEETTASTPTGVGVDLHLPAVEAPEGVAEANLHEAVVTLPQGMVIDPSAANGLQACDEEQFGLHNANPVTCPAAAKVGTAEAVSPALRSPLQGSVYVAQQTANPFGSLLALYLVVEGEGLLVKQAGEVALNPVTGQLTTTFSEVPQQPISDVKLHFFGGSRGALVTPVGCGSYTASGQLTPYSSSSAVEASSVFQISSGVDGSPCPASRPFAPGFVSGMSNNQAGAFSPFVTTFTRQDGEQEAAGVTLTAPPGLLGMLSQVSLCGEPQAAQGTCPASSLIGHTTVAAGAGEDPVYVSGQVFITGPYNGGPFGLSIVVPAIAGPFNLGTVVVRAAIHVDSTTGQITVVSDPLPSILQGVPLQLKMVGVSIDREGFMFNPTNCNHLAVTGTLTSAQGASANVSSRFQAANCAALPFKPSFTVATQARGSKQAGASLDVKVGYTSGQANIAKVAVNLPKQLPSRLTTIQQACPEATYDQNPASCPAGSDIGTATAVTPVLSSPLVGPAYLVSHGGAAFPNLVLILQGDGVTLDLVGSIDIKNGITSSAFNAVPDAPISSFELSLPEGPHSGLAPNLPAEAKDDFCGQSLVMPTTITGQNGAQIVQQTKVAVTGCPKTKVKVKAKKKAGKKKAGKHHKSKQRKRRK